MENENPAQGPLPATIRSEDELDEILTRPSRQLVEFIPQITSPLLVLGASGKMGPSLCLLARRAAIAAGRTLRIVAVSRFSDRRSRRWLETHNIETISCDLLNRDETKGLPEAQDVVYLVGMKFGTQQNPWQTWAINTLVPSHVVERYPSSRIVALSTGNVYPLVPAQSGGSNENDPPAPVGEYGSAALARERIFEYYSRTRGTSFAILRLNYAVELRYGVLVDIAQKVWHRQPIDLSTGYLNCLWQGDANEAILRAFALVSNPLAVFNLTGLEVLKVRELALRFGHLMGREPLLIGSEAPTALLSNASKIFAALGPPATPVNRVLEWIADWIKRDGATLGKPTHFEVRSGQF
ncbi:MAG: NAD-dependent epimerase/dehydratase family protein [Verrucomicrobiia bacterium]